MSLNDKQCQNPKLRAYDYLLSDGKGLYLRVRPSGSKTWVVRRMLRGKISSQTVGTYPGTTLKEARALAAGEALETSAPDRRTVRELGKEFATRVLERSYKTPAPMVAYLTNDIFPSIGNRTVASIKPVDIDRLLSAKLTNAGPVACNMLLLVLKTMFAFAERTGWAKANPAANFKRADAGGTQKKRQRELTDPELRAMWNLNSVHLPAIRLAMLTGCRIGEACEAEWDHIDLKAERWSLPARKVKQSRDHWYALNKEAIALLKAQPRSTGIPRVWPDACRQSMANRLIDTRKRGKAVDPDYTLHDARRTVATRLARGKVNPLVVELVLGHALPKMIATYNVFEFDDERHAAMEMWGKQLATVTAGNNAK